MNALMIIMNTDPQTTNTRESRIAVTPQMDKIQPTATALHATRSTRLLSFKIQTAQFLLVSKTRHKSNTRLSTHSAAGRRRIKHLHGMLGGIALLHVHGETEISVC